MYGEGPRDAVTYKSYFPKEGDMFRFPAWLKHWVSEFNSDCVRVIICKVIKVMFTTQHHYHRLRKGMLKNEDEEYIKGIKDTK